MTDIKKLFLKSIQKKHISLAEQLFPSVSLTAKEQRNIFKHAIKWNENNIATSIIQQLTNKENEYLQDAVLAGNEAAVSMLLTKGADPNYLSPTGENTLQLAIKANGSNLQIIEALIAFRADLYHKDQNNSTSITKAARYGQLPIVQYLQEKSLQIHQRNLLDEEVLTSAVSSNHVDIVSYCLANEVKVNQKAIFLSILSDLDNMTKFLLKKDNHLVFTDSNSFNPFVLAIYKGKPNILTLLLERLPTDKELQATFCSTALMTAIELEHGHLIDVLLKAGADINYIDQGESILDIAILSRNKQLVKTIKKLGGKSYKRNQKVIPLKQ